ncbi:ribonuclease-like storage protein [Trifolium pratense]|uniref:ribonuclease-like storage protein n=1 Tax=Trifolium pratense TaxID=57577 RepID=UPI001E6981B4|nr:ribonuclease-like storage protein [Trifolium pratense]
MQWPPAFCRLKQSKCVKSPASQFKIHGLWPQNKTDPQPRKCSSDSKVTNFKKKMLSLTTRTELATSWPNLKGMDEVFWKQEWLLHGTCSYSTFNQTQYFDAANNIWKALPIFDILHDEQIFPSNIDFQKRDLIKDAINNHIQVVVELEFSCTFYPTELIEIKVCKDHAGNAYEDCPNLGNCGSTFKWKP